MAAPARTAVLLTLAIACVDLSRPPELQVGALPVEPAATGGRATPTFDGSPATGGTTGTITSDAAAKDGDTDVQLPDPSGPADALGDANDVRPWANAPLLIDGKPCSAGDQCSSRSCVDGVCCNTGCSGLCETCNRAGFEGICSPVPAGQDPGNECAMDAVATCGKDGTCDGAGQCRRYLPGTQCAPPGCQGSTERAAGVCGSDGSCQPGSSRSCAPNLCQGDSCASVCATQADCQAGYFCDGGTCAVKRAPAAPCSDAVQCSTGFCADGVCCSSACGETCSACNIAGSVGTCTAAANGTDPRAECPAQAPSSCGRAGGCNGARACRLYPNTTPCAAATCAGSTATAAARCDGYGYCPAPAPVSCGGYLCSGSACGTTCSGDAQCTSGHGCTGGACQLLKIAKLTVNDSANAASWSIQRNFQIGTGGAHPWVDYANTYITSLDSAASTLLGDEWIKLAAASKLYTGGPQASITLAAPADVFIVVDDRWGSTPSFTAGWTNTGWNLTIWETATRSFPFSIFKKAAQTGTVTFPPIGSNTAYDFFIIVD